LSYGTRADVVDPALASRNWINGIASRPFK
jgi:hypothetical protein